MFREPSLQPKTIEIEEEKQIDIDEEVKKLEEMGVQIPEYLQKEIDDLIKMRQQKLPEWVKETAEKNMQRMEREIVAEIETLNRRRLIKENRIIEINEKLGPEFLPYKEKIQEKLGEKIEKHLQKAKNNREKAKKILHLWQDFYAAVDILLEQDSDRSQTDEQALTKAILAFRASDKEYSPLTPEPEIK